MFEELEKLAKAKGVRIHAESKPYSLAHHLDVKSHSDPDTGKHKHEWHALYREIRGARTQQHQTKEEQPHVKNYLLASTKVSQHLDQHGFHRQGYRKPFKEEGTYGAWEHQTKRLEKRGAEDQLKHYRILAARDHEQAKELPKGNSLKKQMHVRRDAAVALHDEKFKQLPRHQQTAYATAHESLKHPVGSIQRKDAAVGLHHHNMLHEFPQLHQELGEAHKSLDELVQLAKAKGVRIHAESKPYSLAHHLNKKYEDQSHIMSHFAGGTGQDMDRHMKNQSMADEKLSLRMSTLSTRSSARSKRIIDSLKKEGAKDTLIHHRYNAHIAANMHRPGDRNVRGSVRWDRVRDAAVKHHDEELRKLHPDKQTAYVSAHESLKHAPGSIQRQDAAIGLHHHNMLHEFPQLHQELGEAHKSLDELDQLVKSKQFSKENAPPILALDLDGTVLKYNGNCKKDEYGPKLSGMVAELKKVREAGWKIVVWTCRPVTKKLKEHLKRNKIPFDYINDHPWNGPDGPRKIHATVYLDDKGMSFDISKINGLADKVINFKPWWHKE